MAAAMERILPSGDGPGATTANAIVYVERMARTDGFEGRKELLERGVGWLESTAEAMWGKAFADCDGSEQDAVLKWIQQTPHINCQRFFAMLVRMTLAGFLCPPEYGGNQATIGWQYIGYVPRTPHDAK